MKIVLGALCAVAGAYWQYSRTRRDDLADLEAARLDKQIEMAREFHREMQLRVLMRVLKDPDLLLLVVAATGLAACLVIASGDTGTATGFMLATASAAATVAVAALLAQHERQLAANGKQHKSALT